MPKQQVSKRLVKYDKRVAARYADARPRTCCLPGCPDSSIMVELPVCDTHWKAVSAEVKPKVDKLLASTYKWGKPMPVSTRNRLVELLTS